MAIARELEEELGVQTLGVLPEVFKAHDPESPFIISFYPVQIEGEPRCLEHSAVAWESVEGLRRLALAPTDALFVGSLSDA